MQISTINADTVTITLTVAQSTWLGCMMARFTANSDNRAHQIGWANEVWKQIFDEQRRIVNPIIHLTYAE